MYNSPPCTILNKKKIYIYMCIYIYTLTMVGLIRAIVISLLKCYKLLKSKNHKIYNTLKSSLFKSSTQAIIMHVCINI